MLRIVLAHSQRIPSHLNLSRFLSSEDTDEECEITQKEQNCTTSTEQNSRLSKLYSTGQSEGMDHDDSFNEFDLQCDDSSHEGVDDLDYMEGISQQETWFRDGYGVWHKL